MTALLWIGFIAVVLALLALDLGVAQRRHHVPSVGEALAWTVFYVFLAQVFAGVVFFIYDTNWLGAGLGDTTALTGRQAAIQYFTAWLIEKSLSVDNIFVIALIFSYFGVRREEQHRVLFWGILGALVLRGILILLGSELLRAFAWTSYVFGAVLIFSAARMLVARHDNLEPERSPLVRAARRWFGVSDQMAGSAFFVVEGGRRLMTPLFLALLVVEGFDLLFAIDSVPAALAVTDDPFLVFTSNIFAVLGMRSLYFVLAGYLDRLRYLKMSLVFLLAYVGVKMMLSHTHPIPNVVSLAIIGGILAVGVLASLAVPEQDTAPLISPLADELEELGEVTLRHARRVVVLVIGSTVLFLGLVLLVAPGPGIPVVVGGLAILGVQFEWARRWLARTRETARAATEPMDRRLRPRP